MSEPIRGLILAYCPDCKATRVVYSKEGTDSFTCLSCHKKISLYAESGVLAFCECGNKIKGITNCTDDHFEFNCKCGYPIDLFYNNKKKLYTNRGK